MMEAMDRIKKAKVAIMRHPKFCAFSGVMAMGTHTLDDSIPTACTDGLNVRYAPAFVQSLNDKQLNLVVLHETLHVAFRHMRVWKHLWKENRKLANIAADHFVNLALVEADPSGDFLEMPAVGVMPNPGFHGWNVQRIFDHLKREQDPDEADDADNPDGEGGGFDQHDVDAANAHSEAEEQAINDKVQQALRQGEAMARKRSADGTGGLDGASVSYCSPSRTGKHYCASSCSPSAKAETCPHGLDLTAGTSGRTFTCLVLTARRLAS